jgi:hypothetical protein
MRQRLRKGREAEFESQRADTICPIRLLENQQSFVGQGSEQAIGRGHSQVGSFRYARKPGARTLYLRDSADDLERSAHRLNSSLHSISSRWIQFFITVSRNARRKQSSI